MCQTPGLLAKPSVTSLHSRPCMSTALRSLAREANFALRILHQFENKRKKTLVLLLRNFSNEKGLKFPWSRHVPKEARSTRPRICGITVCRHECGTQKTLPLQKQGRNFEGCRCFQCPPGGRGRISPHGGIFPTGEQLYLSLE